MKAMTADEACKKHKSEPIFEVMVFDIENRHGFTHISDETRQVYISLDDAKQAARNVASGIAWFNHAYALDHPDEDPEGVCRISCVLSGKKVSKKGTIYGFSKIIYTISTQPKEITERFSIDKGLNITQVDEYTEKPDVRREQFYQWD